ncbi:class D sortase [Cytobacillus kochii]|nr:class D sortase [Cytobacillus kochii]MCA1024696.1 class D sortase [Cytobacillus kochii]
MKKVGLSLMFIGLLFIGFSVWTIVAGNVKESQSLQVAKAKVAEGAKKAEDYLPKKGEAAGILLIPKLDAELPIIEGVDADDLAKGVGHYLGSLYPDEGGQIVLSGHRDTVFRGMGKLKLNDIFTIKVPYGEFDYKITKTKIVDKGDTSVITLQQTEEELIVTTCYPFSFVGDAPERYIIYAERVK